MSRTNREPLGNRVVRAAEDGLARQQYEFFEQAIQGNLTKLSFSMAAFRRWAEGKGLRPSETQYVRRRRGGKLTLQFSKSGDPSVEKGYRTHYISPELTEQKQQEIEQRLAQPAETVAFQILRDSQC